MSFVIDTPTWSRNRPRVALRPAALSVNGWMWINPSPWVWMPRASCVASVKGARYSPGASAGAATVVDVGAVVDVVVVESPGSPAAGVVGVLAGAPVSGTHTYVS